MQMSSVRRYALSLPEATEEAHFAYTSFRVRKKIFVTVPPDAAYVHIFVDDAERERAIALYPDFAQPLWWGGKVRGLRIQLSDAVPRVVKELVRKAWERKAPRNLVTQQTSSRAQRGRG